MTGDTTLDAIRIAVVLLAVAGVAALVAGRLAIPYTVTLVLVGIVAGAVLPAGQVAVTPALVLLVLLPGLVYEAALRLELDALRRTFLGVALLAVPGVVVSAAIVAGVLHLATGLPLGVGFVIGAIVAATDPVAVVSTFRRLGSPRLLTTVVEGESLLNDGTALVVFGIAVLAVGTEVTAADAVLSFGVTVAASTVIGAVAGAVAARLVSWTDDSMVQLTLSLATAYGTYLAADAIHQSGIIATVVAGVIVGNHARRRGVSDRPQDTLDTVWEFLAFVLTAFAFLLVGVAISANDLVAAIPWIAWGVVGITIGRAIVVYGLLGGASTALAAASPGRPRIPLGWLHVLFWAGLRGAVAVAMALSLPPEFPERDLVQSVVFGIVLFTLAVQGTTAERVVRSAGAVEEPAAA